jgi:two-component system OmpR family sensor kinase
VAVRLEATTFDEPGAAAVAWADRNRAHQIIRNLLLNASRYGGPRITAVAGTRAHPPTAFLQIADDGPGVPERLQASLFEPYQHGPAEAGLTEPIGLGLYVSRTLARLMGGDLAYRRENGSTTFELTLPAPPPPKGGLSGRGPSALVRRRKPRQAAGRPAHPTTTRATQ